MQDGGSFNRRRMITSIGMMAIGSALASCGGGGSGAVITPTPTPTPTPIPTPVKPLKIAFAGSSSTEQYLSSYTGPASSDRILFSKDGKVFNRLDTGAFGKVAGRRFVEALNRDVWYIAGGVGGTTLDQWVSPTSIFRSGLVKSILEAGGVDVVLLQVGRNDIAFDLVESVDKQISKLRSLIAAIRSEANVSSAMFFIGCCQDLIGTDLDKLAQLGRQRQAEVIVARQTDNVRFGFVTYDLETFDGVHQTEPSQVISGGRFADQVVAYFRSAPEVRGPEILSVRPVRVRTH